MEWDISLEGMRAAIAPFGGPVALTRDDEALVVLGSGSVKPRVSIYSSAGILLCVDVLCVCVCERVCVCVCVCDGVR